MSTWRLVFALIVLLVANPVSQIQADTGTGEIAFVAEAADPTPEKDSASDSGASPNEGPEGASESPAAPGPKKEVSSAEREHPTVGQSDAAGPAEKPGSTEPTPSAQQGPKASVPVELIAIEKNIIDYTNQERLRYGLPPLEVCPKLMESARRHAAWMTIHRTLRHTSDPVAENIALGQRSSWEAVQDWMRSSGHRANILNPRHRWIGAAAYRTPEGSIYWCQQFRP